MNEGVTYRVSDGNQAGLLFRYSFNHIRKFRTMADYEKWGGACDYEISEKEMSNKPIGPAMPTAAPNCFKDSLEIETNIDNLRESFVRGATGSGIEIGAGDRPTIVPSSVSVKYVDRFSFDEAAKGSFVGKENVNFVEVSYRLGMDGLHEIKNTTLDFVIACHVIEHVPNVIAALRESLIKLRNNGTLFLVVPHHDYIFDQVRPVTTLTHYIADSLESSPPMLDHYLEYAKMAYPDGNWYEVGKAMYAQGQDFHVHTFTPQSMYSLLNWLRENGLIGEFSVDTPSNVDSLAEFYVQIRKF